MRSRAQFRRRLPIPAGHLSSCATDGPEGPRIWRGDVSLKAWTHFSFLHPRHHHAHGCAASCTTWISQQKDTLELPSGGVGDLPQAARRLGSPRSPAPSCPRTCSGRRDADVLMGPSCCPAVEELDLPRDCHHDGLSGGMVMCASPSRTGGCKRLLHEPARRHAAATHGLGKQ